MLHRAGLASQLELLAAYKRVARHQGSGDELGVGERSGLPPRLPSSEPPAQHQTQKWDLVPACPAQNLHCPELPRSPARLAPSDVVSPSYHRGPQIVRQMQNLPVL